MRQLLASGQLPGQHVERRLRVSLDGCCLERAPGGTAMTKFANVTNVWPMTTMNVSLPDELKVFVDERVVHDGYGSTSEYVRDLIRRDRDRGRLRDLVLEGANSGPGVVADAAFFDAVRQRVSPKA